MLDSIIDGSDGACTYTGIARKLDNISQNNKVWRTRKMESRSNTFVVEGINNPTTYEIFEKMGQIKTELGLVLKHVSGGAEKVNALT